MRPAASPTLLAIDTATAYCSIALAHGGHVQQRSEHLGQGHSAVLLPWIEAMFEQADLPLSVCDAIAFGAGPGSFTGLRIACGVAQGLAWGLQKPVIAIGNLTAMAWQAAQQLGASAQGQVPCRVVCAIDARMGQVYWALFDVSDAHVDEVVPPTLSGAREWMDLALPYGPTVVMGNALNVFDLAWPDAAVTCLHAPHASAEAIARLALRQWALGQTMEPAQASPLYVRDQVAMTIEQRALAKGSAA